jgi:hypothetical protein
MTIEQGRTAMQTIQTKSRAIAGSCHSEKAVHAGLRAGSTVRLRTPLALILSGLIVLGSIAPAATGTAYAKVVSPDVCKDKDLSSEEGDKHIRQGSNALDVLARGIEATFCGIPFQMRGMAYNVPMGALTSTSIHGSGSRKSNIP